MKRRTVLLLGSAAMLAACAASQGPAVGPDGLPLPRVYKITPANEAQISFRMLDSVNALRAAQGAQPLTFDAALNAAAATHSRDMSVQNRPWNFGSDGSSLMDRVRRVGFMGKAGEVISETYQTELETLSYWMTKPADRAILLDPEARLMGFAWFQEPNGKIWWSLVTGT